VPYILIHLAHARAWMYLFQMVSHKMLRWYMWIVLLCALISNVLLMSDSSVYYYSGLVQIVFYSCGVVGLLATRFRITLPGLSAPAFFVMGNAAMCVGALKRIGGAVMPSWEPAR